MDCGWNRCIERHHAQAYQEVLHLLVCKWMWGKWFFPDVSRAPFKVVTAAIVKWERDYQILTCSDTFLLVGLTRAWLYKMNDIDTYLTFIIYVHLVYDIPNHCAHYHCIGLVTFLLNTTRIPMTPVPWILNSLLLHRMLSHKLTMTWWEIKAEIIPCSTDFAN